MLVVYNEYSTRIISGTYNDNCCVWLTKHSAEHIYSTEHTFVPTLD